MDYYEELGLDRTATEEEIGRAHRRLAKLLHPDQQTDEAVKQLAETQMRRLNALVETLSDPQRRQEYDRELRGAVRGFPMGRFRRGTIHSWPWWVGSTVGAVVLTVGAVWFSADKWGSSFGAHTPTYIPSGAETNSASEATRTGSLAEAPSAPSPVPLPAGPAEQEKESIPPATTSRTVARVPAPLRSSRTAKPTQLSKPTVVVAEVPRHKRLNLPLTDVSARPAVSGVKLPTAPGVADAGPEKVEAASIPSGTLPAPPKLPESGAPSRVSYPATASNARDALEGEWVYAPTEPEKRKAGFYPPEYIDLKIWNEGGLRGEYRARYHVVNKPIPPDVTFALTPDGNPRHFSWESSNGSKGTLQVNSMDARSIRIEWRTTVFSRGPALTAGTATLVRRAP